MFSSWPFADGLKMSQSASEGRAAEINANSEAFKHPGDATKQVQPDSRKRGSGGLSGPQLAGTPAVWSRSHRKHGRNTDDGQSHGGGGWCVRAPAAETEKR